MEESTTITVICAWCKKPLREVDGGGVEGTSGGICPRCLKNEFKVVRKAIWKRRLNRFNPLRFLRSRKQRIAGEQRDQQRSAFQEQQWIISNPGLHAIILLKGQFLIHYVEIPSRYEVALSEPLMTAEDKAFFN